MTWSLKPKIFPVLVLLSTLSARQIFFTWQTEHTLGKLITTCALRWNKLKICVVSLPSCIRLMEMEALHSNIIKKQILSSEAMCCYYGDIPVYNRCDENSHSFVFSSLFLSNFCMIMVQLEFKPNYAHMMWHLVKQVDTMCTIISWCV